jgi:hypothetical protein
MTPTYPRMHPNGRWIEDAPHRTLSPGAMADDETKLKLAQPGEKGARRVLDVHYKIDRDASIDANLAAMKGKGLGGKVVDAFDVARHATMKLLGY